MSAFYLILSSLMATLSGASVAMRLYGSATMSALLVIAFSATAIAESIKNNKLP